MTAILTRPGTALDIHAVATPATHGPAGTGTPAAVTGRAHAPRTDQTVAAGGVATRIGRAAVRVLLALLVATAVAAFLFLALGPRVLGYQTSTMLTGSMSPLINPGDVVVSVPVPVGDIKVGDIITYHIPVGEQQVETHRVVDLSRNAQGSTAVRTKGDANNGVDPWTATLAGDKVYRHAFTVPFLGTAIRALRDPVILKILMYGAPAVLLVGALTALWKKDPAGKAAAPKAVAPRRRGREAKNA
ncbi:signal peptidase I [Paenarthrobacter sp. PH39-S1]|uniref:signal peptidase I n=1 Tax=Paenarthrobacter sp. PH39-S1 TaxID=3046204 RepID=UPI0024BB98CE|nr:signal peptidase I [Paenarthrobacter sp. PH39-S1]MDJ0356103.1 signal peptidase I [Paenarthrobacter sp. PH39-S1]